MVNVNSVNECGDTNVNFKSPEVFKLFKKAKPRQKTTEKKKRLKKIKS